mmetsp:Transcript_21402/g.52263  ORF Transcript_21402/g.52263 Transcript_21402/m.52263 type:complete len:168 (+) Transcript_21402:85-588(+)
MSVTLHTTLGDIKVELYCLDVPRTCENFLALAASGAYDNTKLHRLIKGFIVQGGDTTGDGGDSIWNAPFPDEFRSHLKHTKRGVLSMANSGPNTNRSQFFFTLGKHEHLNNQYTVFGHIIAGGDVLDTIEKVPTNAADEPLTDIVIERCTIHANPIAEADAAPAAAK